MPSLNDTEIKDVEARIALFRDEHKALVDKHQVDIAAFPMYVPSAQGTYQTIVRMDYTDLKYRNPSPLQIT